MGKNTNNDVTCVELGAWASVMREDTVLSPMTLRMCTQGLTVPEMSGRGTPPLDVKGCPHGSRQGTTK